MTAPCRSRRRPARAPRLLVAGAALAALLGGPLAGAAVAAQPELDTLRARYARLVDGIRSGGGLYEQDRPVVRAVLRDVDAYLASDPDRAAARAMELQLSLWLNEDPDRIAAAYAALEELRPGDAELALAALRWRSEADRIDGEALAAAWAALAERFPGEPEIALEHLRRLKDSVDYAAMIEVLEAMDLEAAGEPELRVLLAEALFAQHRFDEALAALDAVGSLGAMQFRLRTRADELRGWIEDTRERWAEEQELRAAAASADDLPRVSVETERGTIVVELFEDAAPNTVANFLTLARSGFYAGTTFHRFIADFMVQGGDINSKEGVEGTPGTGNPGYRIPDEHGEGFDARAHFRDTLAMANTGAPDSGGSQFYFTHKPTPWLNDRHTVFGRVLEGLHVVRALRAGDRITGMTVLRDRGHDYVPETIPIEDETAAPPSEEAAAETTPPAAPPVEDGAGGAGG